MVYVIISITIMTLEWGEAMVNMKENAGKYAVSHVRDGMVVGLGTGSTAYYFIKELGQQIANGDLQAIRAVATSKESFQLGLDFGIDMVRIDDVEKVDLLVDGADEATLDFNGIKGGGGALLYEKILSLYSDRVIWIVSQDKIKDKLGAFPIAVEVIKFGAWKLFKTFHQAGMNPSFRKAGKDKLYCTDADNYIIDLHLGPTDDIQRLAFELKNMVGVVDHGLFLNIADMIIVGTSDGNIDEHHKKLDGSV